MFSKIIPQWSLHPLRFPRLRGTETFFTIKEVFALKSSRPSLPLKKAPPLTPALSPLERGRKPPYSVLGTATLLGWRTIKGLRQIVRDGTALMQCFLYLILNLIYIDQQKEKTSYIYYYLLINFAANSKKSATFLKSSNCWQ